MSFTLRPVGEAELPELVELYQACEEYLRLSTAAPIDAAYVRADLELSREEGGCFQGIYLAGGTLAGVLDQVANDYGGEPGLAFLNFLMIHPAHRSGGLGAAVVRHVVAETFRDPAVVRLESAVQVDNPRGVTFWERCGFVRTSPPTLQADGTTTYHLAYQRGAV